MNRQTALLGIFIALLLLAGCNGTSNGIAEETIKIGFIGPLTGDTAVVGESALASAQIAIKEINDAGGILGKQVELIIEDGKCRGQDATVAANKLIHIDQVSSIVGGVCSSETIAAAPIAEKAGIVMISPGSSNPSITHAGEYIFRTYPSDSFQGKEAATYLYEKGYRKVAIFHEQSDFAVGIKEEFITAFTTYPGTEIVGIETAPSGNRDIRTQLTRLKNKEPEVLYSLTYTDLAISSFKQSKELGWQPFIFGNDGWVDPAIPKLQGMLLMVDNTCSSRQTTPKSTKRESKH
jgi:branched-chain amino acid transport system substrate-binding protein